MRFHHQRSVLHQSYLKLKKPRVDQILYAVKSEFTMNYVKHNSNCTWYMVAPGQTLLSHGHWLRGNLYFKVYKWLRQVHLDSR